MKVSVVVTVLNEVDTIFPLLNSLFNQTRRPNEIVIVDGGSFDGTIEIIQKYAKRKYNLIHFYSMAGNISYGRNFGIKHAKYPVIVLTDAGCIAKKDWLKKLTLPFADSTVDLVAGFYTMTCKTSLQKAVAPFLGITPRRFDRRDYLPSARSMAFRKTIWEELGGFNEKMIRAGEDTLFNYEVVKNGYKIVRVPSALVEWEPPKTTRETMKKFYTYAFGDAQASIWWHPGQKFYTHNIKILSIYGRYLLLVILLLFAFFSTFFLWLFIYAAVMYAFWSIWKMRNDIKEPKVLLLVPLIQISSDIAIMCGFLKGLTLRFK